MEKKKFNWSDLGTIAMELGGGKLALDIINAILPKPVSNINKITALVIGGAVGNMAFHNQVDPFYDEVEQIIAELKKKQAEANNDQKNS